VADADPLARRALREALDAEPDLDVVGEAANHEETLRVALEERPDIVFVDTELAGPDEDAALRAILRAVPSLAVIVLSVVVDEDLGLGMLYAGANGYLGKETNPATLPRVVRGVARGEAAISRHLTLRVVERMRTISPRADGIRPINSDLSQRQWEVIDLLRRGRSEAEIADELAISFSAARRHVRQLCRTLGASSPEEVVEAATRLVTVAAAPNGG
jgi:DNA-binding NarL/FixJ family response regulator